MLLLFGSRLGIARLEVISCVGATLVGLTRGVLEDILGIGGFDFEL